MKKIFALVLATAMLSSTAFAAYEVNPCDSYVIKGASMLNANDGSTLAPNGTSILSGDFTNSNFAVSTRKFSKGTNLVKSVTINDADETIEIKFNDDVNMARPATTKAPNVVIEKLEVKAKKDVNSKKVPARTVFGYSEPQSDMGIFLGYSVADVTISTTAKYSDDHLTKFVKSATDSFGIVGGGNGELSFEGRVYDGDKIYTKVTTDANKEVLKTPEYVDADLRFYNLITNGFTSNNTVTISAAPEEFIYEVVDNKIVKSNMQWSDDDYAWTGKTLKSRSYVISDIELKAVNAPAAGETPANPETGANDVVGIAAALAVVSLVAAGAVSMKK